METIYGGFIADRGSGRPNTVVAGEVLRQLKKGEAPKAKDGPAAADTPTTATQYDLVIPYTDKEQRLRYLENLKDYLNNQLSLVEAQLNSESSQ